LEVAGDDDYVQVCFNVSNGTSTITATFMFCINEEPSEQDTSKCQLDIKGCRKSTKGRRNRALGSRKESYPHPPEQVLIEMNLHGLKSMKGVSFTCPSNWTASTSSPVNVPAIPE
jgi:hypothetical protein